MSIVNQIAKKKFYLDDTFSIEIEKDIFDKKVWLINEPLQVYTLMATYTNEGRWLFPNSRMADKFLKLAIKFPSIKNNIHKDLPLPYEIGIEKTFSCLKRKFYIKIIRTGNKLKHII